MKKTKRLFFAMILAASTNVFALDGLRTERDVQAKAAFRALNFFAEGRGMNMSPGLIGAYDLFGTNSVVRNQMTKRWGLLFDQEKLVGLSEVSYKKMKIGVIGCAACHTGKAAGVMITGLGNKNIDVVTLATDTNRLERIWKSVNPDSFKSADYREVESAALDFSRYLSNAQIGNLTQGLVPVSFIRGWFYRMQDLPVPLSMPRGQVKIPFLWGYEFKRKVGQFCDGFGNGDKAGWAIAVELAAGQRHEVARGYFEHVEAAEKLFNDFLPPKYPFKVDADLAIQGQGKFEQTCARCHGTYTRDENGMPVFEKPKFVPIDVVKTDPDRVNGNTREFLDLVARSPLNDLIQTTTLGPGYLAPRLDGVWSRFPYLHNGSVPNIRSLLTKPQDRPKYFSLESAGERARFDERALGLTVSTNPGLEQAAHTGQRNVYDVTRDGHSNQGHDFFTSLPDADKTALIEYLKTL